MGDTLKLIDTCRVSKSRTLRISLPRRVAAEIEVDQDDILGFYLDESNNVIIRKMR